MAEVIIYTKSTCPYCTRAKALLTRKKVAFTEIDIGFQPDLRNDMIRLSGRKTVPQIVINRRPIGGCDDLYALEAQGQLDHLLKER